MTLPDVNVLVNALRPDSVAHRSCRQWLDSVSHSAVQFAISPLVLSSVIRIVTHPRIFHEPETVADAVRFCESILLQPNCTMVTPGDQHWPVFTRLCRETNASGNLVPGAWLAALAIESDCELITLDQDFRRFDGLRSREP